MRAPRALNPRPPPPHTHPGAYACTSCPFYDDDLSKQPYHCDACGICRIGGRDNYFHCDTCGSCYSKQLQVGCVACLCLFDCACLGVRAGVCLPPPHPPTTTLPPFYHPQGNHQCVERAMHQNCPICFEFLFESVDPTTVLRCGHTIHTGCLRVSGGRWRRRAAGGSGLGGGGGGCATCSLPPLHTHSHTSPHTHPTTHTPHHTHTYTSPHTHTSPPTQDLEQSQHAICPCCPICKKSLGDYTVRAPPHLGSVCAVCACVCVHVGGGKQRLQQHARAPFTVVPP